MSFNVNTISAGSTAALSRSAVTEQQLRVSQVRAGSILEDGGKAEDFKAVNSTFGVSADKIEISPEGRKALELIYAQRAAKAAAKTAIAAPAAEAAKAAVQVASPSAADAVKPIEEAKPADKAQPAAPIDAGPGKAVGEEPVMPQKESADPAQEKAAEAKASIEAPEAAPLPGSGETVAAEEESVSSADIQNMSVSELRTLVTEGTITRAQMDSELSRRESAEQESEQKAKAAAEAMSKVFSSMKAVDKAAKNMNTYNTTMQYASVAQALT